MRDNSLLYINRGCMNNKFSNDFKRDDYHIYSSAKKLHLYIIKYLSSKIPKVYANIRVNLNDECSLLIKNIYDLCQIKIISVLIIFFS